MALKHLKLAYGIPDRDVENKFNYKVILVKNSTRYVPGQIIKKKEIDDLTESRQWDITIVGLKDE